MLGVLADLAASGHTVVVITHDPEVAAWAERRIELLDGRVVADRKTPVRRESREDAGALRTDGIPSACGGQAPSLLAGAVEWLQSTFASLCANLLRGSRLRTALTVLSVTVGVWSVVAMLSVVQGGYRAGVETVSRADADAMSIRPGVPFPDRRSTPVRLTVDDAEAIARLDNVRGVPAARVRVRDPLVGPTRPVRVRLQQNLRPAHLLARAHQLAHRQLAGGALPVRESHDVFLVHSREPSLAP